MIDTDNMISVEEDDRITAEEAAKTPEQVTAESLRLLTRAFDRLFERVERLEDAVEEIGGVIDRP